MKCTIEINCDNAAFDDDAIGSELGIILGKLANDLLLTTRSDLLHRMTVFRLKDTNGNHAGMFRIIHEPGDKKSANDMEVLSANLSKVSG